MYTFGSDPPPLSVDEEEPEDTSTAHYMTNTSRIDVTLSPSSPSWDRFPSFVRSVAPLAQQAILGEGDMLFMPPG